MFSLPYEIMSFIEKYLQSALKNSKTTKLSKKKQGNIEVEEALPRQVKICCRYCRQIEWQWMKV
jgi:transcriptional regulatory protein LevR